MPTFMQPGTRMFARALLVTAMSACSVASWAQGANQGAAAGPGSPAAPARKVAPPPADLEPGVNTSAAEPSSAEPAVAPAPKPAPIAAKRTPAAGSSLSPGSAVSPGAATGATSVSGAGTATAAVAKAAPKSGASAGKAHDSLELDTTQITGNRELPKVLYIVPWKRSDLGDLVGKPVNSLLDEVLTPVDRDVFKRQNRYYDALKPDDAKDAAGAVTDPAAGKP